MSAPDPFAPISLFSFPIYTSVIAGHEAHKEPLLRDILDLKRKYPGIVRSNRNAWHSGEEFVDHKSEHVAWLLQKVTRFAQFALARQYQNWETSQLQLVSAWANVLGPGGWNAPHHHFPRHWSGVYYVSVGQCGNSREDPGGMIEFLSPTPWLSAINHAGNFLHSPKDGLMIVFPSSIYHFVHPHATNEMRVSIAYNFDVVPKNPT